MADSLVLSILIKAQDSASAVIASTADMAALLQEQLKKATLDVAIAEEKLEQQTIAVSIAQERLEQATIGTTIAQERQAQASLQTGIGEERLEQASIATSISEERLEKASIATAIAQEKLRSASAQASLAEEKLALQNEKTAVSMKETEEAGSFMAGGLVGKIMDVVLTSSLIAPIIDSLKQKITQLTANYEQGMLKVRALTGSNKDQVDQYDAGLKKLAVDAGVAPTKLTDGLYNVLSAGYKGADAMKVLTLATEDAKIGMTSSTVTTDALTNVLRSFGVQSQDVTRVNGEMLETVTLGKATFEQYAKNIVQAASSSRQYGVSMETMNAAWATMTSSGISASKAQTDYTQMLSVMDGNIGTVTASLHKNGIAFDETKFNAMSFGDKVKYLNGVLQEAADKHVHITGVTKQAAQGIKAISDHISDYNANLKTLSDRQAMIQKTQDAWNTTQAGFNQIMSRLKATFDVILISLGQKFLPILTHIATAIAPVLTGFADWLMKSDGLSKSLGGVGDVLSGVWKKITSIFGNLNIGNTLHEIADAFQKVFLPVQTALPIITKTTKPLFDTFDRGSAILQKTAQAAAPLLDTFDRATGIFHNTQQAVNPFIPIMQNLADELDKLKPTFNEVVAQLSGSGMDMAKESFAALKTDVKLVADAFQQKIMPAVKEALPSFEKLAVVIATNIIPVFKSMFDASLQIRQAIFAVWLAIESNLLPIVIKIAGAIASNLAPAIKFLTPYFIQAMGAIGKFAGEIATRLIPVINDLAKWINQNLDIIITVWRAVWPSLAPILKGVWDVIVGVVEIAWALLSGIIKVGLDVLGGNWGQAWTDIQDMFKGIWDGINKFLNGSIDALIGILKAGLNGIVALFRWLADTLVGHSIIPDMVNSIINWFAQLPGRVLDAISSLTGNIGGFFSGLAGQAVQWGSNIIQGLINGINNMAGNVSTAIGNITKTIGSFLPHSPAKQGELRHLNEYGPNLVNGFAQGIIDNIPAVANAADLMTQAVHKKVAKKHTTKKKAAPKSTNTGVDNIAGTGTAYLNQFVKDIALHTGKSQQDAEKMMSNLLNTVQKYQKLLLDAEKSGNKKRIAQTKTDLTLLNQQLKLYENAVKQAGDKYDLNNLRNPITFRATTGVLNAPGSSSTSSGSTSSGSTSNPTYAIYNYNTNLHIDKIEVPIGTTQQQVRMIVDMVEKELGKRQRMQGVIAQSSGVAA